MHIAEGWYSFRVTGTNAQGEMQVFNSWGKFAKDAEHLKHQRLEYLNYLAGQGVKDMKVTHTVSETPPARVDQDDWYLD